MNRLIIFLGAGLSCSACAVQSPLPTGHTAYQIIPAVAAPLEGQEYLIGPLDTVSVTVFREPELSVAEAQVDSAGKLPLPLLGTVFAGGKTAEALASELEQDLRAYLHNPRVTVAVNSITQKVVVEGTVNQPGVYDIRGNSSLLEALAMARSPTEVADLDQIFVFRQIDGQTHGARFNLRRIRTGIDPDPVIVAGDRIVVGQDAVAAAWRDYVSAPIFNVFRVL
jgi:polysaccharide biosynthesis/export protein